MRTFLFAPWVVGLVLCASASAEDQKRDDAKPGERSAVPSETIRGIIAGVTVQGELAVDYRTRKAVETEWTLLTVVGSPRHANAESDKASSGPRDEKAGETHAMRRHHRNLYILAVSPRTTVRDDRANDHKGAASSLDALEIGDWVEIKYTAREEDKSGRDADQARRTKHGRHRTYFGDANTITILAEPAGADHNQDKR